MGFRDPLTSLSASQITAGKLPVDVVGQVLATAAEGRRIEIATPMGSAGRIDFYADADGPGQPAGHASIDVEPYGGVSGWAELTIQSAGPQIDMRSEYGAAGGSHTRINLSADRVVLDQGDPTVLAAGAGWQAFNVNVGGGSTRLPLPSIRQVGDTALLLPGWLGRSSSLAVGAGATYTGVLGNLPRLYWPIDRVVPIVGVIDIAGTLGLAEWQVRPDGTIAFAPFISGTLTTGTNSYIALPAASWPIDPGF